MADFGAGRKGSLVRRAEAADTGAIFDLYRRIEPEDPIDAEGYDMWWRWLHAANPVGTGYALGAFAADGRNVGHAALLPFRFVVDGEVLTAGFPCQFMVDEALRRSLVYPTLVSRLLKEYSENGFNFCYATVTRPRVLEANVAMGFRRGATFPIYARPYRCARIVAERFRAAAPLGRALAVPGDRLLRLGWPFGRDRAVSVEEVAHFPDGAEPFLTAMRPRFPLAALRTAPILNWRFTRNARRGYRILLATRDGRPVGYAVTRRMPMKVFDTLALVDLLYDPDEPAVGNALLGAVHRMAVASGVDLATTMAAPHNPYLGTLRRWGFLRTPEGFTLITHEPKGGRLGLGDRPFADWHLTWFDHDFV